MMLPVYIKQQRGSVLVTALWAMALLSMLTIVLVMRSNFSLNISSAQRDAYVMNHQLYGGALYARYLLELDEDSDVDTLDDLWFGVHVIEDEAVGFPKNTRIAIQDESSKLNVNAASQLELESLLEYLKEEGRISAIPKECVEGLLKWRGTIQSSSLRSPYKGSPFESVDELLLVPDLAYVDAVALRSYFTVFGNPSFTQVNINLVSEPVLWSILQGLSVEESVKSRMFDELIAYRIDRMAEGEYFTSDNMSASDFIEGLGLSSDVITVSFFSQLLSHLSADTTHFNVVIVFPDEAISKDDSSQNDNEWYNAMAMCVIGPHLQSGSDAVYPLSELSIVSWEEQ